ncbi:MAG: glycoside hydrolase family 3 N-terminal domain-containing protein [Mycobacteriales bacterium]
MTSDAGISQPGDRGGEDAALRRLVNRCLLVAMDGHDPTDGMRDWLADGLGGVLLFAPNITGPDQLRALAGGLREAGEDVLVAVDEEGGDVTRLHAADGSPSPGNLALGAAGDPDVTRRIAAAIGAELAAARVNLNLAPVADVNTNPDNPIIGTRSFGADPDVVAAHVVAYVEGLQSTGVAGCAKHFPGHGDTSLDSHLALPTVTGDLADLAPHLVPFRAAIKAGVRSILTAHVVFPALDERPATISHRLLTGLLREELGFDGVIVTDSMTMAAIADGVGTAEGAVQALLAGADLICMNETHEDQLAVRDHVLAAVRDGRLPVARLEEAAARVTALGVSTRDTPAPDTPPDFGPALAAARAALTVRGVALPLPASPYVIEVAAPRRGIGLSAGSLLTQLRARDPAVDGIRLHALEAGRPGGLEEALRAAAGRPLLLVVRDAHRDPSQRATLQRALSARPDAIVVGIGTTGDAALASGGYVGTRGGAGVNLEVAADALVSGPVRRVDSTAAKL